MLEITKNRYNYFYVWNSVGLTGLVPPCHRAFMGPKFFLVGILWVPIFFLWVFRGPKIFSRGYFVGPKCYDLQQTSVKNKKQRTTEDF